MRCWSKSGGREHIWSYTEQLCGYILTWVLDVSKKNSLRTDGRWEASKVVRFAQSADPIIGRGAGGRVEPFFYQPSSSFMTDSVLVLFPSDPSWFLFSSANCCQAGRTKDGEETGQIHPFEADQKYGRSHHSWHLARSAVLFRQVETRVTKVGTKVWSVTQQCQWLTHMASIASREPSKIIDTN